MDDLEDEELEDSLEDNMNEKEDADVIIDSNQISPVKSNQSLTPPQSTSSGLQLTSSQNGNDVNCAKEKQKRKKKRSTRRVILKTVNNVCKKRSNCHSSSCCLCDVGGSDPGYCPLFLLFE